MPEWNLTGPEDQTEQPQWHLTGPARASVGTTEIPKAGTPTQVSGGNDPVQSGELYEEPVRARDLFLRQMIGQGAFAGFGDEAEAAARATADKSAGHKDSWSSLYDKYLTNARRMNALFEQKQPGLATEAQLVGAIGGLAIPGPDIVDAATLPARAVNAALKGATYGAASGFGTGEGTANRLLGAEKGAAIGGATGALAAPISELAITGLGGLAQPAVGALNPGAVASGRIGAALTKDAGAGLSAPEFAAAKRAGLPVTTLERGGEATRALMRSAANTSATARQTIEDVIQPRFEEQGDRIREYLSNIANRQDASTARAALEAQAVPFNARAYAAAYSDPQAASVWGPELQQLTVSPAMKSAIRRATATGANKAAAQGVRPPVNPFVFEKDGSLSLKQGVTPNLQFWDYVKRNLDDQINVLQRAGKKSAASDTVRLKNTLVGLLDRQVPSYQSARAGASAFFGAQDAISAGENFVGMKGNIIDAEAAWNKLSPQEQELFKVGFVSKLRDSISKVSDRADVVRRIFGSNDARERINLALGARGANQLDALLSVESLMDQSRKALGNSTTARQLTELGAAGGVGGIGFGLLTGDWSPRDLGIAAILGATSRRMGMKIDNRIVESVAKQLTSSDPRVYQNAIRRVAQNKMLLKLFKTAASLPMAPAVKAGQ